MRPRKVRRFLLLALFGAIAAGSGLGTGIARADVVDVYVTWKAVNICNYFSLHPQVSAVEPMFRAIQADTGFTATDTGTVLVAAVASICPEFLPVLSAYANSTPLPQTTFRSSAHIGGRIA